MIVRADLDAMTAVFDRRAGVTHMLAEPAMLVFDALQGGAGDAPAVAAWLGFERDEGRALVTERLDELVATGLIEQLDADT